jgi:GNAT superfamily N-acetyltransferase
MEIIYRNATISDMDFLVESRLDFIHVYKSEADYQFLKNSIQNYFEKGFKENRFDIILAEYENSVIGTGIIFYYDSVPSTFNPWGKNAYITSMFVNENYRRRGIATKILDKLIQFSISKGYHVFILQESDMGRALYEKYGFQAGRKGMILKIM